MSPPLPSPVRSALADALALVLPVECAGCGAPDRAVCPACEQSLQTPVRTRRLARSALEVFSATAYAGPVQHLLPAVKDGGRTEAAGCLGAALRRALEAGASRHEERALGPPEARAPALVVPVPSARAATRRRGYLPVLLLLRRAGVAAHPALRFCRRVRDQSGLSAGERARNIAGSMTAAGSVAGRRVILVDDVVTTGASLLEAARAIEERGGLVLFAATVASTPPPDAPVGGEPQSPET